MEGWWWWWGAGREGRVVASLVGVGGSVGVTLAEEEEDLDR